MKKMFQVIKLARGWEKIYISKEWRKNLQFSEVNPLRKSKSGPIVGKKPF